MPVENSRLKGFYKLSVKERRDLVAELAGLDQEAVNALAATGELTEAAADRIIDRRRDSIQRRSARQDHKVRGGRF